MAMHAEVLDEPELEFGGGTRHIDPRFGIINHGPADLGAAEAPHAIRVGLIGPADQLSGVRAWFERCREPITAKDDRYPHLFPEFPGCDIDCGLRTTLVFSDRNTRAISDRDLRAIAAAGRALALQAAVDLYAEEITALADENRVDVLIIARPEQLIDTTSRATVAAEEPGCGPVLPRFANFHDMLKARVLKIRQPIQIIRRSTWDESASPPAGRSRQDEASRAWNLHVALYYKAGGVPWRLPRKSADLTTCYVGVAFYRNDADVTLDTSVAQVFNERGDGVIVRGGPARVSREDLQPHLTEQDARALLLNALDTYRREHRTLPARLVLHKTSSFTAAEIAGFQAAADERGLDTLEMSWITNSEGARLFRPGAAPPLRGTLLALGDQEIVLYTKGSIEFYSTYPGMYVPQPIGIRPARPVRSARDTGSETLALTKMNWNQTRLDGRDPVTIRTANQVKAILRFCSPDQAIATRYANYM
jgi:hypothetical protein